MNIAEQFLLAIALLFLALVLFKLFSAPLRLALKVAANTALGFLALIALDLFSPLLGLHIGVNLVRPYIPPPRCFFRNSAAFCINKATSFCTFIQSETFFPISCPQPAKTYVIIYRRVI